MWVQGVEGRRNMVLRGITCAYAASAALCPRAGEYDETDPSELNRCWLLG